MRDAIRNHLISTISSIGERCFEPHAADAKTEKPYLVVRQGTDAEESAWTGFRRIMEVWPNVARTTFVDLDTLEKSIKSTLHNQLLQTSAGEVFTCSYIGAAGPDEVDEDFDIITRGLRFSVMALQPVAVNEIVTGDPWIDAIATWSEVILGDIWTVYQNYWPLGYVRPSILFRLSSCSVLSKTSNLYEVTKKLTIHVLGDTPNRQIQGIMQIVESIGSTYKIPLNLNERRYLTVKNISADHRSDAIRTGQISLTLSRNTSTPIEDAPLIAAVHIDQKLKSR